MSLCFILNIARSKPLWGLLKVKAKNRPTSPLVLSGNFNKVYSFGVLNNNFSSLKRIDCPEGCCIVCILVNCNCVFIFGEYSVKSYSLGNGVAIVKNAGILCPASKCVTILLRVSCLLLKANLLTIVKFLGLLGRLSALCLKCKGDCIPVVLK